MARSTDQFKKLPGRPFSMFGVKRLWQGPDHLLWVETVMGQEHYRRFFYNDIQAIILKRTRIHHYWSVLWSMLALLFGIVALTASNPVYVSSFLAVFFLVCLGLNWIFGPTCMVYLQTAVQLQQISLGRLNKSLRVVDRLKERIQREQGELDMSTASTEPAKAFPASGALHAIRPEQDENAAFNPTGPAEPLNPLFSNLLFGILVAAGGCKILQYMTGWLALGFLDLLLIAAGLVMAAITLVRGHRRIKGSWLGHSTWAALVFFLLHGLTDYVYYLVIVVQNPDLTMNHWELLKRFVEALAGGRATTMAIQLGSAAISLILGVSGFLALRKR